MSTPPLIISGMHRSGTSLLAQVLEASGLFIGWRQQGGHGEAKFFQDLNLWLLKEAGGSWEYPDPIRALITTPEFREPLADFLRYNVEAARSVEFLGPKRWLSSRGLLGLDEPWGWKDPRTTVTLPLWLDVFPEARVIHIKRHGMDVAASLRARHKRLLGDVPRRFRHRRWQYQFTAPKQRRATGFELTNLEAGLKLWSAYEQIAEEYLPHDERSLTIRYEDLLADPDRILGTIGNFYPLGGQLRAFAGEFESGRAYAYREDPELVAAAREHAGVLARHGY